MRLCFCLIGLVLVSILTERTLAGGSSEEHRPLLVEGWITNNLPAHPSMRSVNFALRSDGRRWLIRFSGPLGPAHYREVFFDGDKTCYLNYLEPFVEEARARGEKVGSNIATAMVRAGSVPYFPIVQEAGLVWLTYLSGPFFEANGLEGCILPPCSAHVMASAGFRFEDLVLQKYRRTGKAIDRLGVPYGVDYFFAVCNPRDAWVKEVEQRFGLQTNAIFRLQEVSEVNGQRIPVQSVLQVVVPAQMESGSTGCEFHLRATHVTTSGPATNLIARIPGLTHFTDARFVLGSEPLLVSYEALRWLSDEEVRALPQYRRVRALHPSPVTPLRTVVTLAAIVFFLLLPIILKRVVKRAGT